MAAVNLSASETGSAAPLTMSPDEVVENFELFDDWDSRYVYLVELGDTLPPMDDALRVDENRVKGCMSQVWVCAVPQQGDARRIAYQGDCDTAIIKGVLALLVGLCSDKTAEEIARLDIDGLFGRLRLQDHLSPNRHFGIFAIVELMKQQAADLA